MHPLSKKLRFLHVHSLMWFTVDIQCKENQSNGKEFLLHNVHLLLLLLIIVIII